MTNRFLRHALATASAALALALAAPAMAQAAPDPIAPGEADPALWVVRDADTTIYLFGTIHLLPPGLTWFDEAVREAFDASNQLVLELPEGADAEAAQLIGSLSAAEDGVALSSRLNAEQRATYEQAMASFQLPVPAFESREPWMPAILLSVMPLVRSGYDPNQGVEMTLRRAAAEAGKPVSGLETAASQINLFDSLPIDQQVEFLVTSARMANEGTAVMNSMVGQWRAGDPEALGNAMNQGFVDFPELREPLLAARNRAWADWIGERLMEVGGTYFVAVGAGHLAGSDSVQAVLTARGLPVERIAY